MTRGLGVGGWGSWGRQAVGEERRKMVGKDVKKARFVLEFVSCGGLFIPEKYPEASGVCRICSQTFRRERGELHKNDL